MTLINCKECGKEVSTEAATCPNCGASLGDPERDLRLAILILVLLVFLGVIVLYRMAS